MTKFLLTPNCCCSSGCRICSDSYGLQPPFGATSYPTGQLVNNGCQYQAPTGWIVSGNVLNGFVAGSTVLVANGTNFSGGMGIIGQIYSDNCRLYVNWQDSGNNYFLESTSYIIPTDNIPADNITGSLISFNKTEMGTVTQLSSPFNVSPFGSNYPIVLALFVGDTYRQSGDASWGCDFSSTGTVIPVVASWKAYVGSWSSLHGATGLSSNSILAPTQCFTYGVGLGAVSTCGADAIFVDGPIGTVAFGTSPSGTGCFGAIQVAIPMNASTTGQQPQCTQICESCNVDTAFITYSGNWQTDVDGNFFSNTNGDIVDYHTYDPDGLPYRSLRPKIQGIGSTTNDTIKIHLDYSDTAGPNHYVEIVGGPTYTASLFSNGGFLTSGAINSSFISQLGGGSPSICLDEKYFTLSASTISTISASINNSSSQDLYFIRTEIVSVDSSESLYIDMSSSSRTQTPNIASNCRCILCAPKFPCGNLPNELFIDLTAFPSSGQCTNCSSLAAEYTLTPNTFGSYDFAFVTQSGCDCMACATADVNQFLIGLFVNSSGSTLGAPSGTTFTLSIQESLTIGGINATNCQITYEGTIVNPNTGVICNSTSPSLNLGLPYSDYYISNFPVTLTMTSFSNAIFTSPFCGTVSGDFPSTITLSL